MGEDEKNREKREIKEWKKGERKKDKRTGEKG